MEDSGGRGRKALEEEITDLQNSLDAQRMEIRNVNQKDDRKEITKRPHNNSQSGGVGLRYTCELVRVMERAWK